MLLGPQNMVAKGKPKGQDPVDSHASETDWCPGFTIRGVNLTSRVDGPPQKKQPNFLHATEMIQTKK